MELTPSFGLAAREVALGVLSDVLDRKQPLDESFERALSRSGKGLEPRDRAFARLLATTTLRRLGEIHALISRHIERPLPADARRVWHILELTAAQLVFLATPAHAAVDSAVSLTRAEARHVRLAGLVNAVSRRLAAAAGTDADNPAAGRLDTPDWLWRRWLAHYGEATASRIANAHLAEPALDLSTNGDAEGWALRLGGLVLATGGVRLTSHGRIEGLDGYDEGGWWVQDAAAALPVRLLGDVRGLDVADLCAAPGGKTAQLAAAGARVTAVDGSRRRLGIARRNLERLKLDADLVEADIRDWAPGRAFPRAILDAPCLATGTIRRHPDLPYLKSEADLPALVERQRQLLDRAIALLAPGGTLVYCTCSLEVEEGGRQIAEALATHPDVMIEPIRSNEAGILPEWLTPEGYLRTLPFHSPGGGPNVAGMDGFFAARLVKASGRRDGA